MVKLIALNLFILISSISFASTQAGTGDTYRQVAREMCNCVNESMDVLSERMIGILRDSGGDEAIMQSGIEKYVQEDYAAAMKDVETIQGPMIEKMTTCFDAVEERHKDVYEDATSVEIEQALLKELEDMEGCEVTLTFFKIGLSSSGEDDEDAVPDTSEMDVAYIDMAVDLCNCINEHEGQLSQRMRNIFIESDGDLETMNELIQQYVTEDEENAKKDAELLQGEFANEVDQCMSDVELIYQDVYDNQSEEEIQSAVINFMDGVSGCEFLVALMRLGMAVD